MTIVTHRDGFDRNTEPASLVYLDAAADARNCTADVLESGIELFASIADDPDCCDVERYLASERLAAFTQELARRVRVARLSGGQASSRDQTHAAWTQLARTVRSRTEVPDILRLAGLDLRPAGRSRCRDEFSSSCPLCGGTDRLRCWSGPSGRLWCRRCRWSGDAIAAASLIAGPAFRDCVAWLADHTGLTVPR